MVRLSPFPAVLIDAAGRCRAANDGFREAFGSEPDADMSITDWLGFALPDPADRGMTAAAWEETAGEIDVCQAGPVSIRCRGGAERAVILRWASLGDGNRVVTCEEVQTSAPALFEVIDSLPDPTFVLDLAGTVIAWNRAIEELTGVARTEMLGCGENAYAVPFYGAPRPLLADLVLDEAALGIEAYTGVTRTGRTLTAETFIPSWNNGAGVHLWGRASLLRDPGGEVTGVIESIRDITAYRHTEQELRRSEERYRGLVETLRDIIYEVDEEGTVTYVSPAVTPVTGYAPGEVVGKSLLDLVDPRDRDRVRRGIAGAIAGDPEPGDVRLVMASGDVRCFRTDARPILADGVPVGLRGVLTDITDRVAAEAAVRWNEALLAQMAEASPFGYYVVDDRTGRVLYCNDRFCDLWGLGDLRERMRSGGLDQRAILPRCAGMVRSGEVFSGPDRTGSEIALTDGRRIWQYSAPLGDDGDRRYGRFYLFEDVTAQERMVEELREYRDRLEELVVERTGALAESEERSRRIFDQAPIGMAVVSLDGRYRRVNPALSAITGYAAEELLALGPRELVHPDDARSADGPTGQAGAGDVDGDARELRYLRRDGIPLWVRQTVRVVHDQSGHPLHFLGMVEDVTARKEAEERLRVYADELRRSNEDLQQFAYVASHDLQEPLRSIISFGQLLERRYRGRLDENADEFIAYIVTGGERMQALIRDLLQVSRVETGAKPPEPTDAGAVVNGALRALEVPIREVSAIVTVEPLPAVLADSSQLEQVFVNLVGNAIKYGRDGVPPEIRIEGRRVGPMVEFAVRDKGIGIEAEYFDRIFEMFRRLHTHDEYGGTGIGLAVVKKVVERHGGRVWVESTPGEGSTFVFTLPAA